MRGSLRELPKSKRDGSRRWELRVYVGRDPDKTVHDEAGRVVKQGPPIHVSQTFHGGKREAQQALTALLKELDDAGRGDRERRVGTSATVGKLLTRWLDNLAGLDMARSTLETYRTHVEKHIRPGLGDVRLDRLGTEDVDRYLRDLDQIKGLSPGTIKLNHAILRSALTQGVDWGWLKSNPATRARLKSTDRTPTATMTAEQHQALYRAALADDPDMAVAIALATTGMRRGELCGLRWDDVDAARAVLRVERAWVPGKGGQHLSTTKTGKAREVFIGAGGVRLLQSYWNLKAEQLGHPPDGWLLSYDGGETPMRAKSLTEYVSRTAKRLGIPAHFHTFRHRSSTELHARQVDMPTAAAQLGHTTAVMAETYLHTSDDRRAAVGELVGSMIEELVASDKG
jgi:integrase